MTKNKNLTAHALPGYEGRLFYRFRDVVDAVYARKCPKGLVNWAEKSGIRSYLGTFFRGASDDDEGSRWCKWMPSESPDQMRGWCSYQWNSAGGPRAVLAPLTASPRGKREKDNKYIL